MADDRQPNAEDGTPPPGQWKTTDGLYTDGTVTSRYPLKSADFGIPPQHPATDTKTKTDTVWLKAIRPHTYRNHPKDVGDVYLAHADMVETIVDVHKFAVRDIPPPTAVRPVEKP